MKLLLLFLIFGGMVYHVTAQNYKNGHSKLESKTDYCLILYLDNSSISMDYGEPESNYYPIEYFIVIRPNRVFAFQLRQGAMIDVLPPEDVKAKDIIRLVEITDKKDIAFLRKFNLAFSLRLSREVNKNIESCNSGKNTITIYNVQSKEKRCYNATFDVVSQCKGKNPTLTHAVTLTNIFTKYFKTIPKSSH